MDHRIIETLSQITEEEKNILSGHDHIEKNIYTDESRLILDSKKFLKQDQLIFIRTHTRFIHFPKHTHNYVEVIYMCSGQTHHMVNGDEVILKQGELLFLNQNAVQEVYPANETDIAVNFIILPAFFDEGLKMMSNENNRLRDFMIGSLRSEEDGITYLHFKVAEILPIQNLVENLIWNLVNDVPKQRNINQVTMGLLILQLLNYTEQTIVGKNNFEQELMLSVLYYIETQYKDGSLTKLSIQLNYNIYWLSRMIKKMSGMTYSELVKIKRLEQASYLLENTALTISDIGQSIGYDNLSYFYRIFKKKYGMSPRQYRIKENNQNAKEDT